MDNSPDDCLCICMTTGMIVVRRYDRCERGWLMANETCHPSEGDEIYVDRTLLSGCNSSH